MSALPKHYLQGSIQLHQSIGCGAMGEVFLATLDRASGTSLQVAVKQVRPALLHRPEVVRTLEREARVGARLDHPNLVKTLGLIQQDSLIYLVMEYVEGITLRQLLSRQKSDCRALPLEILLEIALQLSLGLEHAHSACDERGTPMELVHRDLKPENILLNTRGEVKIGDFGLAKSALLMRSGLTLDGLLGTVAYMSPEQAGAAHVDKRSDLYSLGTILFEMLTLERLYPQGRGIRALDAVWQGELSDRLKLLESHSLANRQLVEKLLERQPERRPPTAGDVAAQLTRLVPHFASSSRSRLGELVAEEFGADRAITLPAQANPAPSLLSTLPLP